MVTVNLENLNKAAFLERYAGLYEHSAWIADTAWEFLKDDTAVSIDSMHAQLKRAVNDASKEQQLTLLKAHPELAGKAAVQGQLTAESNEEQSSARLDQCSQSEFDEFQMLNKKYNERFGFPFILAVRGRNRAEILSAFRERVGNSENEEFDTAIEQVHQIALLRLVALHGDDTDKGNN